MSRTASPRQIISKPLVAIGDLERETERRPLSWSLARRIWSYTWPHRRIRNVLLGLCVFRAMQLASQAGLLGWVVQDTISHRDPWRLAGGTLAFLLLTGLVAYTARWRGLLGMRLGEAVVHDLRRAIFVHLQRLGMGFYSRTKVGRLVSRMTSDAESVRAGIEESLFISLVSLGQMLTAAAFMLAIDPGLFLLVLVVAPMLFGINLLFRRRLSEAHRNQSESFSRVTATIAETVGGIRVTQGFNREAENARLFGRLVLSHAGYNLATARLQGLFLPLLDLNNQVFLAGLLLLGGYLAMYHHHNTEGVVQFFFLAWTFFGPVTSLGNQYNTALIAMAGAERVFTLLDQPPEWQDPPQALRPTGLDGHIEFDQVVFAYETGRNVLQGISFTARPGTCTALVGHTGCGKTTIINLLAKFRLPTGGLIRLDGQDLRSIDSAWLHRHTGLVLQVNFLFTGTVLDNIRMVRPTASEDEVRAAASRLGCLDILEGLSDGLHTQVGEGGAVLSSGQRQLVCLTRAMLADPRLLLLDEATSAIDPLTEFRIQQALDVLLRDRTSFVVAHRLSTIRHADQVLVLERGRIVERGRHDDLVAAGGIYHAAWQEFVSQGLTDS